MHLMKDPDVLRYLGQFRLLVIGVLYFVQNTPLGI